MSSASTIPNINVTGATGSGSFSTGGPGNMNFGNSANPNPSTTTNPNPTALSSTGQLGIQLGNLYGTGIGSLIQQYLNSNGGFNSGLTQQAVAGQANAAQYQTQMGADNLTSMLASMGITGGSSSLPQSLSSYFSQATTGENAISSQEYYNMWNQSQQNEYGMLSQVGQVGATGKANELNWMDYASFALGLVGAI
jgi:hypothetical protein